jgi:hypothetical protein
MKLLLLPIIVYAGSGRVVTEDLKRSMSKRPFGVQQWSLSVRLTPSLNEVWGQVIPLDDLRTTEHTPVARYTSRYTSSAHILHTLPQWSQTIAIQPKFHSIVCNAVHVLNVLVRNH